MFPPRTRQSALAASHDVSILFHICFVFVTLCIVLLLFLALRICPFFLSLVSSLAHQLDVGLLFFVFLSLVSALFLCFPVYFFVSSFCWYIKWTYRRTDRASKQQPYPLGTRPAP